MHKMSEAYNGLSLWVEARVLKEKALEQERLIFGDRSIEVARTLGRRTESERRSSLAFPSIAISSMNRSPPSLASAPR